MKGITKRFPGVTALSDVSLTLRPAEILGLVGENGAGKSTLISVLGGMLTPDEGSICIQGNPLRLGSVTEALERGVSIIHQELNLAENLDIASNILLGREPAGLLGKVDRKAINAEAARQAAPVGLGLPVTTPVEDLSQAQRQLVEIAKALSLSARILVLDEPTSSLTPREAEGLFAVMRDLKARGVAMIYISHRLHEVEAMCDRVVVLRDGRNAGELEGEASTRDAMVGLMVGRDVSRFFPEAGAAGFGDPVLSVRGLRCPGCSGEFTFDVRAGEVFGIAGLMGAGRTDLVRALFGVNPLLAGEVRILGRRLYLRSPRDAIRSGLALVPEDRKELGVFLEMNIRENVSLPSCAISPGILVDGAAETAAASEQACALGIKAPNLEQAVGCLSGGNQQKVVLAKWLALRPKVLILDEPTRGIDVGSKSEIYRLIRNLADEGMAVVMVSSEMEEIIGLCDRVMVMHEGAPRGFLEHTAVTEEAITCLATGGAL
jgi:ribose transport system ATP-binding protein